MKNKISQFRKAKGLTQKQLSEIIGQPNYQVIQAWELGTRIPSVINALQIARALDTTVEQLYPIEED